MIRVLALLALLAPGPAAAHAILMDSTPAPGATVAPGPLQAVLRFNSRIDAGRSTMSVRRGASSISVPAQPGGSADEITVRGVTLTPGEYVLRWQVLAVDGHVTRGDVPFSVRAP